MDDLDRLDAWLDGTEPVKPLASIEVSKGRLRARIDRALDLGNRSEFLRLSTLLKGYQAR